MASSGFLKLHSLIQRNVDGVQQPFIIATVSENISSYPHVRSTSCTVLYIVRQRLVSVQHVRTITLVASAQAVRPASSDDVCISAEAITVGVTWNGPWAEQEQSAVAIKAVSCELNAGSLLNTVWPGGSGSRQSLHLSRGTPLWRYTLDYILALYCVVFPHCELCCAFQETQMQTRKKKRNLWEKISITPSVKASTANAAMSRRQAGAIYSLFQLNE